MGEPLSAEGLARFDEVAASHIADDKVPGLVALVARGDQVHLESLGSLSVGGQAAQDDSLFRIASTTKPVTAVATLAMMSEGLVSLEEAIDRLLPELADARVLRVKDGSLDETVPPPASCNGSRIADVHLRFRRGVRDVHKLEALADRDRRRRAQVGHLRAAEPSPATRPGHLDHRTWVVAPDRSAGGTLARQHWRVRSRRALVPGRRSALW